MARRSRRSSHGGELNAWPGYVDALSTLLMVVTFVLLVFVLGQQFLSVALSKRTHSLDALRQQLAALQQTLSMTEAKNTQLNAMVASLTTDRDSAKHQADVLTQQLATLNGTIAEKEQALAAAGQATQSDQATIAELKSQLEQLNQQLLAIGQALDIAKKDVTARDQQITDLGNRLNVALADKVNQLKRYRSEFFGRLQDILKNQKGVEIVGDRFVFQSSILFPQGSADLTPQGEKEIAALAHTFKQVSSQIPADIPWILRVDGHADKQPIHTAFPSNWELSSARAITVVKVLIREGVDPHHLAATGFSDYQPLDQGNTAAAYTRNRRIEFRLTDR